MLLSPFFVRFPARAWHCQPLASVAFLQGKAATQAWGFALEQRENRRNENYSWVKYTLL
jgi:hypothetical protein